MKKSLLKYFIISLICIYGTLFFACSGDIEAIYELTSEKEIPVFFVKEFETYYSDSGIVQVKIKAPVLYRYSSKTKNIDEYPDGIEVFFFDNNMNTTSTLSSNYAKYYIDEELWEARGNVEVINIIEDESLNTELLYWDLQKEKIYSNRFVRIKTNNEILFGQGFESNQEFSRWRILKPTGTVSLEDE